MRIISKIGRSPTGSNGFGITVVYGLSRVPFPPTKISALITVYSKIQLNEKYIRLARLQIIFIKNIAHCK